MRALVVEHDPLSTPECVGDHLERQGISLEHFVVVPDMSRPDVTRQFPGSGFDLVVTMGSPWSVYDPRIRGWLLPELDFLRTQVRRGTPMLNICFGAQALSVATGGRVTRSHRPEYGWERIDSSSQHISPGPWFQFHHDEFTVPLGGVELARNASGVQAFSLGRSLATQFHPEVSGELIVTWLEAGGAEAVISNGGDPDLLLEETFRRVPESQPALEGVLDWWLSEMVGGPAGEAVG